MQWAKANGFVSMLSKDAKHHMNKSSSSKQSCIDGHLQPILKEKVIPYSNKLFCDAAIWWLVYTDQVAYIVVAFMIILMF